MDPAVSIEADAVITITAGLELLDGVATFNGIGKNESICSTGDLRLNTG